MSITLDYWTRADQAELDILVWKLVDGIGTHRANCGAHVPCTVPGTITGERKQYDLAPLSAPPGFYADVRDRIGEHLATCEKCAPSADCSAETTAIEALRDWLVGRRLLSRAQHHRALADRWREVAA